MSKQYHVYIPDDWVPLAEKLAKEEHLSPGAFFAAGIVDMFKSVQDEMSEDDVGEDGPMPESSKEEDSFRVNLRGDDATLLKKKASELGISPTDWLRNAIHRKDLTVYWIQLDDLEELLDLYERNVAAIEGIVSVCRENNNAFKQDVELIRELMETVHEQLQIQILATLGKRKKEKQKRDQKGFE